MEKKEVSRGPETRFLKVLNYFVPKGMKTESIFGYAFVDGTLLAFSYMSASSLVSQDIKTASMFGLGLPFLLEAHRVIRGPVNLNGEPWK